jgi:hypothetical protein
MVILIIFNLYFFIDKNFDPVYITIITLNISYKANKEILLILAGNLPIMRIALILKNKLIEKLERYESETNKK